jgi:hypothetical protein
MLNCKLQSGRARRDESLSVPAVAKPPPWPSLRGLSELDTNDCFLVLAFRSANVDDLIRTAMLQVHTRIVDRPTLSLLVEENGQV